MANPPPHGTNLVRNRRHPVFNLEYWVKEFPLGKDRSNGGCVATPGALAESEEARALAGMHGDLGPSVPADVFVWASGIGTPKCCTRLGGLPWRSEKKPWPKDADGVPLHFIGQVCFLDSRDIVPCELPGDVVLIFARWSCGGVWSDAIEFVFEWARADLNDPTPHSITGSPFTTLPFCYDGVIHRTRQYLNPDAFDPPFQKAGWEEGGWSIADMQATSVSTFAGLPQGWPFEEGDGNTLICTLSSFYFMRRWPLCNVRSGIVHTRHDGSEYEGFGGDSMSVGFGDAGAVWIYRDREGKFNLNTACG